MVKVKGNVVMTTHRESPVAYFVPLAKATPFLWLSVPCNIVMRLVQRDIVKRTEVIFSFYINLSISLKFHSNL